MKYGYSNIVILNIATSSIKRIIKFDYNKFINKKNMLTSFLLLTDKCNLNCGYCFNKTIPFKKNKSYIGLNDWLNIIDILTENKVTNIIFSGGEPLLLNDQLFKIIQKANSNKIKTLLLSNSIGINKESVSELKASELDDITLSLNELASTNFDENEKKIYSILENYNAKIELCLNEFENITVIVLISKMNYKFLNRIFNYLQKDNVSIIFQPVYDKETSIYNLAEEDWKDIKLQLSDWTIKYEKYNYIQIIYDLFKGAPFRKPDCMMGTYAFVIDWYGDVYNCFHKLNTSNGNIIKDDAKKIFINLIKNSSKSIESNCFGLHCVSLFFNQL